MRTTHKCRPFELIPGVECCQCYGVIWPDHVTSNGNPWLVRPFVARYAAEYLDQFDAWVAEMAGHGWTADWPAASIMPRTDWRAPVDSQVGGSA